MFLNPNQPQQIILKKVQKGGAYRVMKPKILALSVTVLLMTCFCRPVLAQAPNPSPTSTPPLAAEEKEALYNQAIATRTLNVMKALAISDDAKSNRVHDIVLTHYRALRARDE